MPHAARLACWIAVLASVAPGFATPASEEPITPLPEPPRASPLKIALGERLFTEPRLSANNARSCATCHNLARNGASQAQFDTTPRGTPLKFNTSTVFNSALSFRLGWEGKYRTFEAKVDAVLADPDIMNCASGSAAAKLAADPTLRHEFEVVYGRGPDAANLVDALAVFERSLITTGSRFDRWLRGDANALTAEELDGYRLFKSLGCIACHQGVNVGGNLYQRHGIFHPLGRPDPPILRVPSLRNVATTPPYFHDGSAATLDIAVRQMAFAQLNSTLTDAQVQSVVAFLRTLTGLHDGKPVGGN
jgi:cytochrome c peroxidase